MYKMTTKNKKTVAIAQTGVGWNVATYSVKGNRVYTYARKNTRTLADAKKVFTQQKKKYLR